MRKDMRSMALTTTLSEEQVQSAGDGKYPLAPAVYIVGKDGLINFSYVHPNYRVRLDSDVLLAAVKVGLKE